MVGKAATAQRKQSEIPWFQQDKKGCPIMPVQFHLERSLLNLGNTSNGASKQSANSSSSRYFVPEVDQEETNHCKDDDVDDIV